VKKSSTTTPHTTSDHDAGIVVLERFAFLEQRSRTTLSSSLWAASVDDHPDSRKE
jgi:hypothetical protein